MSFLSEHEHGQFVVDPLNKRVRVLTIHPIEDGYINEVSGKILGFTMAWFVLVSEDGSSEWIIPYSNLRSVKSL